MHIQSAQPTSSFSYGSMPPEDAAQMALPYELARKKFYAYREPKQLECIRKFEAQINALLVRIPTAVTQVIDARHPQGLANKFALFDGPCVIQDGHMGCGCARFDENGEFIRIHLSMPLLFAPAEVGASTVAHEIAHVFLRAEGRRFTGIHVPRNCILLEAYQYDTAMVEEELEVDRLTQLWGLGHRRDYTAWETAVFVTKKLECEDLYLRIKQRTQNC